jgi:hypothetical protein
MGGTKPIDRDGSLPPRPTPILFRGLPSEARGIVPQIDVQQQVGFRPAQPSGQKGRKGQETWFMRHVGFFRPWPSPWSGRGVLQFVAFRDEPARISPMKYLEFSGHIQVHALNGNTHHPSSAPATPILPACARPSNIDRRIPLLVHVFRRAGKGP